MSRLFRSAALLLTTGLAAIAAQAQSYSTQQLQDLFSNHLRTESLAPEITNSGNVRFRRSNRTYIVHVDERDPLYFRLTLAFVAEDKSDTARHRRLEACNVAASETKVVKCFLDADGDPTFAAEMFVIVPGDFKASFSRTLRAVDTASERFNRAYAEMR